MAQKGKICRCSPGKLSGYPGEFGRAILDRMSDISTGIQGVCDAFWLIRYRPLAGMQSALQLRGSRPTARPLVLTRLYRFGAWPAADTGVSLIV